MCTSPSSSHGDSVALPGSAVQHSSSTRAKNPHVSVTICTTHDAFCRSMMHTQAHAARSQPSIVRARAVSGSFRILAHLTSTFLNASNSQYASYSRKLSQTTGMSDCNLLTAGYLQATGERQTEGKRKAMRGQSETHKPPALRQSSRRRNPPERASINSASAGLSQNSSTRATYSRLVDMRSACNKKFWSCKFGTR